MRLSGPERSHPECEDERSEIQEHESDPPDEVKVKAAGRRAGLGGKMLCKKRESDWQETGEDVIRTGFPVRRRRGKMK